MEAFLRQKAAENHIASILEIILESVLLLRLFLFSAIVLTLVTAFCAIIGYYHVSTAAAVFGGIFGEGAGMMCAYCRVSDWVDDDYSAIKSELNQKDYIRI